MRPVIVCTEHRGVFYGYTGDSSQTIIERGNVALTDARMAIYWGTDRGVMQLAETGPTGSSKISAKTDITINKITAVFEVSDVAHEAWKKVA